MNAIYPHPSIINWPSEPGYYLVEWLGDAGNGAPLRDVIRVFRDSRGAFSFNDLWSSQPSVVTLAFRYDEERAFVGLRFILLDLPAIAAANPWPLSSP